MNEQERKVFTDGFEKGRVFGKEKTEERIKLEIISRERMGMDCKTIIKELKGYLQIK